jgi:Ribonuclease G/E
VSKIKEDEASFKTQAEA